MPLQVATAYRLTWSGPTVGARLLYRVGPLWGLVSLARYVYRGAVIARLLSLFTVGGLGLVRLVGWVLL
jgi:hypothetical protein